MANGRERQTECARIVALLSRELDLTAAQQAEYVQIITNFLPERCSEAQIARIVRCYHLDHQEVRALRDVQHPQHHHAWSAWPQQVLKILRDRNLDWLADSAIDQEDLVQIGLKDLYDALPSFRFNSRLSTWAYTVVVRAARHVVRDRRASKRSAIIISLDDPETAAYLTSHKDNPAANVQNIALIMTIEHILNEHGGPRWVKLFRLWIQQDQRLVDIGRQIGLSPTRVSVLLGQMADLLRQHVDMREWYHPEQADNAQSEDTNRQDDMDAES